MHAKLLLTMTLVLPMALGGCLDFELPGMEGDSKTTSVPSSIIGYKMVQTVRGNDKNKTTIDVDKTITYQFIDADTILGEGVATVPTESWSYRVEDGTSRAKVTLVYDVGTSVEDLVFNEDGLSGTYRSTIDFTDHVQHNEHWGTFVISKIDANDKPVDPAGCEILDESNADSTSTLRSCRSYYERLTTNDAGDWYYFLEVSDKDGAVGGRMTVEYEGGAIVRFEVVFGGGTGPDYWNRYMEYQPGYSDILEQDGDPYQGGQDQKHWICNTTAVYFDHTYYNGSTATELDKQVLQDRSLCPTIGDAEDLTGSVGPFLTDSPFYKTKPYASNLTF